MRVAVRLLIAVAVLLGIYAAWHAYDLRAAYAVAASAPQGQATGPANAGITIVEFMDYRCDPCRQVAPVMAEVARRHPDIRIVYRDLPTHGKPSVNEALIALAAGKQGHFMDMHALLFARAAPVTDEDLPALCQATGVVCDRLRVDMHAQDLKDTMLKTLDAATVLNVRGAPAFLVGRTLYTATKRLPTADDFDAIIAQARQGR